MGGEVTEVEGPRNDDEGGCEQDVEQVTRAQGVDETAQGIADEGAVHGYSFTVA